MGNSLATRAQKCKISRTSSGLKSGALTNAYLNAPNFVRVLLCGNTMSYLEYLTSRVRCTGLTLKCVLVQAAPNLVWWFSWFPQRYFITALHHLLQTGLSVTLNNKQKRRWNRSWLNTPLLRSNSEKKCTTKFNTHKLYVLPTQRIDVFCVDLRTNSDYFPTQHSLVRFYNWEGVFTARYGLNLSLYIYIYNSLHITL
jgi:hypothetical protein